MTKQAFRALVGVEFQRSRQFLKGVGIMFSVATVAVLVLGFGRAGWSAVLSILGISLALQVPLEVAKDKMTGGLELLTTLPLSASTLAAARLTAGTLFSALSALSFAVAAGVAWPGIGADASTVRTIAVSFPVFWITISACCSSALGLALRFKAKTVMTYGFLTVLAAYLTVAYLYDRLFGSPLRAIQAIMASDHTLLIATGTALVASALVLAGSFLLARKGLEVYEPEPDAMDW